MKKFMTAKEKFEELMNRPDTFGCNDMIIDYGSTQTYITYECDGEVSRSAFNYLPKDVGTDGLLKWFVSGKHFCGGCDITIKEFANFIKDPTLVGNGIMHAIWASFLLNNRESYYEEKIEDGYVYDPIKELGDISLGNDMENEKLIFALINTAHYDSMGVIVVECDSAEQLEEYGFQKEEIEMAEKMNVGDKIESVDYGSGAIVVRIR